MRKIAIIIGIFAVTIIGGYLWLRSSAVEPEPQVEINSNTAALQQNYQGKVLAGSSSVLLDFNKADYDAVLKNDKLIVLYFYANWCPICREEVPKLYSAFNELATDKVVGFRVNYNDNQTDDSEWALAKEFGVGYQHTKVFLKNGQRILKAPDSWNKERYISEINSALQ